MNDKYYKPIVLLFIFVSLTLFCIHLENIKQMGLYWMVYIVDVFTSCSLIAAISHLVGKKK